MCLLNPNNSDSVEMISCMSDLKEDKAKNYSEVLKHCTEHKVVLKEMIITDSSGTIHKST